MKVNWGTGIVIAFVLFMGFILYFVFKVQSDSKYDNELVIEDYYKHDARYGEEIQKMQHANNSKEKPLLTDDAHGIKITFPESFETEKISGKVSLYRPSDKKLDFDIPITLSDRSLLIPKSDLAGGRWDITLSWKYGEVDYMMKKTMYLN